MVEGGPCGWLDEKHLLIEVHYPRGNTADPAIARANESGHEQYARIVKLQDPEVDIKLGPGYGTRKGTIHYSMIDKHTSVADPSFYDPYLVEWMKREMNWTFITPPDDLVSIDTRGFKKGPDTGVVLEPRKLLVPSGNPKSTKWLESIGCEVVEVECSSLVRPRNSGSIHHAYLRGRAAAVFGAVPASRLRIVYGGSVKPDNAAALLGQDDVNGALVGGASLDVAAFSAIIRGAPG